MRPPNRRKSVSIGIGASKSPLLELNVSEWLSRCDGLACGELLFFKGVLTTGFEDSDANVLDTLGETRFSGSGVV